ncbi:SDR family NAD(P)-dependent oxidoreductase [Chachezhania sediminis]|uniref:SDR family NAD(P)-dependent oxidoreductase n=1 Tax=Chachezhania sediminis TaxID=2599291 RepID=UPI00131AC997|nr:SDR family oxidoreductase [Chachezhania sediminis]
MITYDFSGRHAVVTGAGGGMGEALAAALLNAGATVTGIDIKPAPESLANHPGLTYAQGDLTDAAFIAKTIGDAGKAHGGIDHLANVAGVLWFGRDASVLEMDMDVWDQVFDINLKAVALTARAAVPFMKGRDGASMVHFSTIQWLRGDPAPQDAYQASKAGVCALSKSLAMQLAADGVRSNAICPGMALTPLQARWEDKPEILKAVGDYAPLGRIGTAEDMANAALFLLSDAASYITGIDLAVDGGLLMKM